MMTRNDSIVLLVLVVLALVGYTVYKKKYMKENWWGGNLPSVGYKVMPEAKFANGMVSSLADQVGGKIAADSVSYPFVSVPSFQSLLAPRFNSTGYGPYITYNLTDYKNQGVPCNPLGYGKMAVSEPFVNINCSQCGGGCGASVCAKSGMDLSSIPTVGINNTRQALNYETAMSAMTNDTTLPVDTIEVASMSSPDGEIVVMDRYMYANKKSRLYGNSDYIRGDLSIVPEQTGWFRPSVNPLVDLNQGAMNVMGGYDNNTSKDMAAFLNSVSGGAMNVIGGVDLTSQLSNSGQDLSVMAFP